MKEENIINLIKQTVPSAADFIGDDTAYIKDRDLILTQDTLIENIHFRRQTISAYDLGYKSVAVNLSDIAAAGGIAEFILVSVGFPSDIEETFVKGLYSGINDICSKYGVLVVGGDTCGSNDIVISISAIGKAQGIVPSKRSNAQNGDFVVVTGNHGSSGVGLWLLENECKNDTYSAGLFEDLKDKFKKAHTKPEPQLKIGRVIAKTVNEPLAMMDSSDGLADALYQISKLSNVSMEIDFEDIPYDKDIEKLDEVDYKRMIFYGGEDYQLVATISPDIYNILKNKNVSVYRIGKVVNAGDTPVVRVNDHGKISYITHESLENSCFDHFLKEKRER